MDKVNDFGNNLRRLIKAHDYKTFQKAADAFGITLSFLNQLMSSQRKPSLEVLNKISNELRVPVSDLLGEPQTNKYDDTRASKTDLIGKIVVGLAALNESQLVDILDAISDAKSDLAATDLASSGS